MSKVRCLAFLDNPLGRDTEILLPITYVMERYLEVEVTYLFTWDLYLIRKHQPDIVLIPNTRGHPMYVEIAAYAKKHDIKVLALDSEGNFPTDGSFDYWGYNTEKKVYQEWITCWSDRTADFTRKLLPEHSDKIKVTGGTGFDRYQFSTLTIPDQLKLKIASGNFKHIIGYAGWGFGKLYSPQKKFAFNRLICAGKSFEWAEEQRVFVRECLRTAIEAFPDTLFILKKHPKENFEDEPIEGLNEMNELVQYPNVLYTKNEFRIEELIHVATLWCGFETTTFFEAWMMKKETITINADIDFPRTGHFRGSVLAQSNSEFIALISEHLAKGRIASFYHPDKDQIRTEMLENTIGKTDGLNHLRTCYYFRKSIPNSHTNKQIAFNWRQWRLYVLMHFGRFLFNKKLFLKLRGFRKSIYVFENRGLPGFNSRKLQVYRDLESFHKEKGLEPLLRTNNWESLRANLDLKD